MDDVIVLDSRLGDQLGFRPLQNRLVSDSWVQNFLTGLAASHCSIPFMPFFARKIEGASGFPEPEVHLIYPQARQRYQQISGGSVQWHARPRLLTGARRTAWDFQYPAFSIIFMPVDAFQPVNGSVEEKDDVVEHRTVVPSAD